MVAEGGGPAEGLAQLGADGDRGRDPLGDLLPLPLRHGGDHGVEEAAGRGRGVDRLLERDEVGARLAGRCRRIEKLLGVPGEPGELREDEAGDVPAPDVARASASSPECP